MRVFRQLEGFGSYGFPESHAVSFALLVYVSSWLKCYYPDVFACALLNSMPMGFYQPAQIVIDARKHEVPIVAVDINYSYWDNTLEEKGNKYRTMHLGFRQVKGLREDDMQLLINARKDKYTSIHQLRQLGISDATLEKLADADAFRSLGHDRRKALWEVTTKDQPLGIFSDQKFSDLVEEDIILPDMTLSEHVVHDYTSTSLSLKGHPVSFIREELNALHIISTAALDKAQDGDLVKVAGLILVRQRPGTASGICFITLEDEWGTANLVVFGTLFDKYRKEIIRSRLLMVEGKLQREGEVIHVIVSRCFNYSRLLQNLIPYESDDDPSVSTLARPDETSAPPRDPRDKSQKPALVQGKIFGEGRNFR
jgi:error-prone DNA polymerase